MSHVQAILYFEPITRHPAQCCQFGIKVAKSRIFEKHNRYENACLELETFWGQVGYFRESWDF